MFARQVAVAEILAAKRGDEVSSIQHVRTLRDVAHQVGKQASGDRQNPRSTAAQCVRPLPAALRLNCEAGVRKIELRPGQPQPTRQPVRRLSKSDIVSNMLGPCGRHPRPAHGRSSSRSWALSWPGLLDNHFDKARRDIRYWAGYVRTRASLGAWIADSVWGWHPGLRGRHRDPGPIGRHGRWLFNRVWLASPYRTCRRERCSRRRSWLVRGRAPLPVSPSEFASIGETWTRCVDSQSPTSCYPRR